MNCRKIKGKIAAILALGLLGACSDGHDGPNPMYSVGGSASGLAGVVTLSNSTTGENIEVAEDSFSFAPQSDLSEYSVSVSAQPDGQICELENAAGTVLGSDVSNLLLSCHSRWQGTQQFGSGKRDTATDMQVVQDGSSLFLGRSYSVLSDAYFYALSKREATGAAAWLWLDEQEREGFYDAAIDDAGNVYVVSNYSGADGIRNYLIKLNARGEQQWVERLGGDYLLRVQGLVLGSDGNLYAAGYTDSDAVEGQSRTGIRDLFVMQLSTSGQLGWLKLLGEAHVQSMLTDSSGIAETPDGDIVVSYARYSETPLAPGYGNEKRLALARFSRDGLLLPGWPVAVPDDVYYHFVSPFEQLEDTREPVMALDAQGELYLSGFAVGDIFPARAEGGTLVLKLSGSDASLLWRHIVGEPFTLMNNEGLIPLALVVDESGNIFVAGQEFGYQRENLELTRLDSDGELLWTRVYEFSGQEDVAGIGFDPSGRLLFGGVTDGELDGNSSLGDSDYFLMKLNAVDGEVLEAE